MASRSVHEAFVLQTDFVKSAFEGYFAQLTKLGELFTTTAKDSFAPLKRRVAAITEIVQSVAVV
jgi:phasin family protein